MPEASAIAISYNYSPYDHQLAKNQELLHKSNAPSLLDETVDFQVKE